VQAVTIQVNVKDLPERGLVILSSSDPSFNEKFSFLLRQKPSVFVETLKPFSFIFNNMTDKSLVAYQLKWEMVKADGTINTRITSFANPRALMDGGAPGLEHLSVGAGHAIKASSSRFISLFFSLDENPGGGIGAYSSGSSQEGALNQIQQMARNSDIDKMVNYLSTELQDYTRLTVIIDGAFFEDGTFVGPDSTRFFANFQANLDAKRDLLEEISFGVKHKQSLEDIFNELDILAKSEDVTIDSSATPTDYYNHYKRLYSEEILRMRKATDPNTAISRVLQALRKPWPELRKQ